MVIPLPAGWYTVSSPILPPFNAFLSACEANGLCYPVGMIISHDAASCSAVRCDDVGAGMLQQTTFYGTFMLIHSMNLFDPKTVWLSNIEQFNIVCWNLIALQSFSLSWLVKTAQISHVTTYHFYIVFAGIVFSIMLRSDAEIRVRYPDVL